jgi:hypothetical protein
MASVPTMLSHSQRRLPLVKRVIGLGSDMLATLGALALLGAMCLFVGGSQPVSGPTLQAAGLVEQPGYDPELVTPVQLRAMQLRDEQVVIVDVRGPDQYRFRHLAGAINVPGFKLPQNIDKVPLGVKLALYCS